MLALTKANAIIDEATRWAARWSRADCMWLRRKGYFTSLMARKLASACLMLRSVVSFGCGEGIGLYGFHEIG